MTPIISQTDPWAKYDHPGKGHIVPEPAYHGALILFVLIALYYIRNNRPKV